MANQYIDMDTLRFLLYDVHEVDRLLNKDRFNAYDKEAIDLLLDSIKDLSDKEMFPYIKEMDEQPAVYKDGRIHIHPQFEKVLKMVGEMGMIGAGFDAEAGGLQLPASIVNAAYFIMEAANNHIPGYFGLTAGAAHLIIAFGDQKLNDTYVQNMLDMKWGGTMCLTEPQAGSSLSDIITSAEPREDGTYKIEGQKIFISSGDHQFADNFVHLVLARIKGAPAGTKGISLFVVPRSRVEDGDLAYNHVATLGEFNKMGQKGYCTTHLGFSDGGDSIGWMVGEPNKGLKYMFQMMNEARIATGRMGTAIASAAYFASLEYAKERPQGRRLTADGSKNVDEEQTLIINHPDVKRMLLLQKAIIEGSISLITEASHLLDQESVSEGEEKESYRLLLELLTPIVKTYPAEKGKEAIDNGVQILGGYGFTTDFVLQQYYRDVRIISLYEGTTGIQSLDLLGRKVMLKNGEILQDLARQIQSTVAEIEKYDELKPYGQTLMMNMGLVQEVIGALMPHAMKGDHERFLADATLFMDFFSTIVIGWQWLKIAAKSKEALVTGDTKYSEAFHEGKVHTMKFFYKYEMGRTRGLARIIQDQQDLTLETAPVEYL